VRYPSDQQILSDFIKARNSASALSADGSKLGARNAFGWAVVIFNESFRLAKALDYRPVPRPARPAAYKRPLGAKQTFESCALAEVQHERAFASDFQ
jgi:hypothetical protein